MREGTFTAIRYSEWLADLGSAQCPGSIALGTGVTRAGSHQQSAMHERAGLPVIAANGHTVGERPRALVETPLVGGDFRTDMDLLRGEATQTLRGTHALRASTRCDGSAGVPNWGGARRRAGCCAI